MMRSQAVALPNQPLDVAGHLVDRITSGALDLDELASIADGSLSVTNAFTRARIIAERQIAQQFLFDDDAYAKNAPTLRRMGWTPYRISTARGFLQLSLDAIDEFADAHTAALKEATVAGARTLKPVAEKPTKNTIAHTYTAPPIDVQIAREFGMDAADDRAELLIENIQQALDSMPNPKHAYVWARYHGLQDDGTLGDKWTFEGIANSMPNQGPVSREYVEGLYYRASTHVFQRIAVGALNALQVAMDKH